MNDTYVWRGSGVSYYQRMVINEATVAFMHESQAH